MNKPSEIRTYQLYPLKDSYCDIPEMSKFLHVRMRDGFVTLYCLVDPNQRVSWRRLVALGTDEYEKLADDYSQFPFIGAVDRPSGNTLLYFLDPKIYDADRKPVTPK